MEKYFVTFEQALVLKELGFDEPCFRYVYIGDTGNNVNRYEEVVPSRAINYNHDSLCISQPLKSQVFEWFREKHNIKGFVEPVEYLDGTPDTYVWFVYNDCHSGTEQLTFEEAEYACIDKLIEYVKLK
jgi:hypothetical protein